MLSMLLTVALMCSYIEALFPIYLGVPGARLGLTNIVIVLVLYLYGPYEAILINLMRILLVGFLFTNLYSVMFSLSGAICSYVIMLLFYKRKTFSVIGVSILGGVFHNIGQLIMAGCIIEDSAILFYLPMLLLMGTATGLILGILDGILIPVIKRIIVPGGK